ncbi:trigger factor [Bacteroides oleiciplenus]|uniref:Trigger factor n=2 Tax=Bacteroides oleiciplenus TaxID=626931 RepID=K9EGB8_9BACE|nr:trigger factor [Bacteroides oleiciplenus]EKU89957.1 trigger factor [Bacteroides oleiciplenus YIT 12058]RGN31852.1 trigger factor [Bacteroides oleiciplenus]
MNVSLQNIDKVSALLTVKLEKADYQEKVDKSLKSIRQKAQIPGFRKGMVPMSLVKKMYAKSAIAEEVNKALSEAVYKYIQDNKVNILGEPLPNEEKQQEIDFDTMEEFEFLFDIALAPEFKAEVDAKDTVDYYTIDVTEDMVSNQVKAYTQRNGKYEQVDVYEDNDMLKGLLAELDENGNTKEGGIQVEGAVMMPAYMKNDEQKAIFANAKVNDVLVFNPHTAWDGNAAELASLLKIDNEAAAEMKSNFSYQVEEVTRFVAGELTQEIFDQVCGKDVVKTEEEFRAKVKEVIANQFVADTDYKFLLDARKMLMEKVGKLEFPDALLKRIMRLNNQDKDEKFVEDNYDKSIEELTWHLIKEQLVKANDIKVEQEDVVNMAKEATRAQFAQYGMMNVPEELLENYSKEMLKKKESVEGLVNRVVEAKLASALKSQVKLNNKTISAEEFNKMFE